MASTKAGRQLEDPNPSGGTPLIRTTASTANGLAVTIPAAWFGRVIEFTARTTDCAIRFGASGVQVDMTAESGGTPPAIAAGGKEPNIVIQAGQTRRYRLAPAASAFMADGTTLITTFAHISTGAGQLFMCPCNGTGD